MKKYILDLIVSENKPLSGSYHLLKLTADAPLPPMLPGQFAEILVDNSPTTFLRRPISINFFDREKNELWLLVQKVGDGTRKMCEKQAGETLNLVFPLGNTFTIPEKADFKPLLIGGGVGVAPLLFLGAELHKKGVSVSFLLGARSAKDLLLLGEFEKYGKVFVTTEDGSAGEKGFVTQHSILTTCGLRLATCDFIYTCGPTPMMKAVARYAVERQIPCEVSLENTMSCGVGACLCCVTKTREGHKCV
ncbi:MAG: dihydroorotate dehydrogenase electron transfer subunit, partial [Prevotellaceae bacterium]|nr:dihydroorotate dehydrogenase electron transfer subunit [Prevotellaceae bacterium]